MKEIGADPEKEGHSDAFDFDRIELWGPLLRAELDDLLPSEIASIVANAEPEYIEDARDKLFEVADRKEVIERTSAWIENRPVFGYHGTRLGVDEVDSVRRQGLRPLVAASRAERLRKILSEHPCWTSVEAQLEDALLLFGPGEYLGRRQGQVHLTVSRAGLTQSFNHYITHGSEFDSHVAYHLLGEEGQELLSCSGSAIIVKVCVPGQIALAACNIYRLTGSGCPNLVSDVLRVWAYWLAHANYQSESLELDCGMVFKRPIPASWISELSEVNNISITKGKTLS